MAIPAMAVARTKAQRANPNIQPIKRRGCTMVTAKKTAIKKTTDKSSVEPKKKNSVEPKGEEFRMPLEVKEWIDQASSRMMSMRTEIERLKEDNAKLRRANKVMEQRVMGMSTE
jgi:hypothetical protein